MNNRVKKLNRKINRILNTRYVSNEDLHKLFYLYDELDWYVYHQKRDFYRNQLNALKIELRGGD